MISILVGLALATTAEQATSSVEVATAKEWVSLIDQRRWTDSWDATGKLFQSQMPRTSWTAAIRPVREPLGAVMSRTLKGSAEAKSLPGAPDGDYKIVQFTTSFAAKKDGVETVVLARETSGWKVNGYFIR